MPPIKMRCFYANVYSTPEAISWPIQLPCMNGHDAAHPLDWSLEAGPTITALGGPTCFLLCNHCICRSSRQEITTQQRKGLADAPVLVPSLVLVLRKVPFFTSLQRKQSLLVRKNHINLKAEHFGNDSEASACMPPPDLQSTEPLKISVLLTTFTEQAVFSILKKERGPMLNP
ncbi:hypothetical protein llap_7072 [Limosa lapponica baueri]|uniref:Uncharacterized protein n=1 Tax=Limosa lapponica baueri TaxID=1758121 RepID=A0A2I0U992_LIMLA|nr:hypothetical protein llap_7072 [Limosa lapponica baueri]